MYSIIKLMKYIISKITTRFPMVLKDDMETVVENIKETIILKNMHFSSTSA